MMEDKKQRKVLNLTLNDEYIDQIVAQLNKMKTDHNKIVKITNPGTDIVLVMNHLENDLLKKRAEAKAEEKKE